MKESKTSWRWHCSLYFKIVSFSEFSVKVVTFRT